LAKCLRRGALRSGARRRQRRGAPSAATTATHCPKGKGGT
jgi:hypothetical protein